jgi:hypothetical protein
MNQKNMLEIVEKYSQKNDADFGDIQVTRVPDHKTVHVETIGDDGRAILMTEYKVAGAIYWAGYSTRSQTVYISLAS